MSSSFDTLAALRDHLAAVPGVATCRIGLEANMTPQDYPMVRIVPSSASQGATLSGRQISALIYFGQPIHEFSDGIESLYESLLDMEEALTAALRAAPGMAVINRETVFDEDRVDAYKLMALRVDVLA